MTPTKAWWLFSPAVDLVVFVGSALLSLAALLVGWYLGWLTHDTPEWAWIVGVLLIDVAHVYATVFRVYADPQELRRAPGLYAAVPAVGWAVGIALYSTFGELVFWRLLAYVAVYHFVRQQYGWVMLYRARCGERDRLGRWIDSAAIYAATLYPLLYWHAHLPRRFWWFLSGDFTPLPVNLDGVVAVAGKLYVALLILYVVRACTVGVFNPGKHVVVATTALCWYVGIVALNSDYAFTLTNVLIHGIPYLALVYWYGRDRARGADGDETPAIYRLFNSGPMPFLLLLWLAAFFEEMVWDRAVWQQRPQLFGAPWNVGEVTLCVLVPLLALPQLVHYVLDGFVWKRRSGPFMRRLLS